MQKGERKAKLSEMKTKFSFMKCFTDCLLPFSCSLMNYFPLVLCSVPIEERRFFFALAEVIGKGSSKM